MIQKMVRKFPQAVTAFSVAFLLSAALVSLAQAQVAQSKVEHACAVDLKLDPSTADYQVCVETLDREQMPAEGRSGRAAKACAEIGDVPNSPALNQCAADLRESLWNAHQLDE